MKPTAHFAATTFSVITLIAGLSVTEAALASNECRIEYGHHTGSGLNRKDKKKYVSLNANQTKTINTSKMNYVKNLKSNKVRFTFQGTPNITLNKNAVSPVIAYYLTPVKLRTIKCLNQTSADFASPEALLEAWTAANKSAGDIALALKDIFHFSAQQAAQALKNSGFSANQVAVALKQKFGASAERAAGWLKTVGYPIEQIAAALMQSFNGTPKKLVGWLKAKGYSALEIAGALKDTLMLNMSEATRFLSDHFSLAATVSAIKLCTEPVQPCSLKLLSLWENPKVQWSRR